MRVRQPNKSLTLNELRDKILAVKEEGRKLVVELDKLKSHYAKMLDYYEAWEVELNNIQRAIDEASKEHNIPIERIEEYDALEDVFGE